MSFVLFGIHMDVRTQFLLSVVQLSGQTIDERVRKILKVQFVMFSYSKGGILNNLTDHMILRN